jgi:hypothetical protein
MYFFQIKRSKLIFFIIFKNKTKVLVVQLMLLNVITGNVFIWIVLSIFLRSKKASLDFLQSANKSVCSVNVINQFMFSVSVSPKLITLSGTYCIRI